MTHTRTELDALTAKALRPIAADLGITGASRMTKDVLISAIITAESTEAAKDACDVADFDEQAVYTEAAELSIEPGDRGDLINRGRALGLMEGDLLSDTEVLRGLVEAQEAVRVVPPAVEPEAELTEIPEPAPGAVSIVLETHTPEPTEQELTHEAEIMAQFNRNRAAQPPVFVKPTKHGSETVVVERVDRGRVSYRVLDPKTGRRSASYRMREVTFRAKYTPVPA